jgi:hypothetical protein
MTVFSIDVKIGDTVTVIKDQPLEGNSIGPNLEIGQEHEVNSIHECSCGQSHIDIRLPLEINYVTCYNCGAQLPKSTQWCHPSRFTVNT